jgi:peptidoglycan/xylan/chitin deacetylase (PgdA/CDA1 family)
MCAASFSIGMTTEMRRVTAGDRTLGADVRVLGLIYHDVSDGAAAPASGFTDPSGLRYLLTRERFERHLDAIEACGVAPALVGTAADPQLLLTFDDGGVSAATTIAPLLESRGWRGHFFVVTGRVGTPGFLGADAVRELHAAGHVVGSHTHTHPDLARLGPAAADDEWRRSRAGLEDLLCAPVTTAAVPGGSYTRETAELAFSAGYQQLFTSDPTLTPRPLAGGVLHGRFSIVDGTPAAHVGALCRLERRALLRDQAAWRGRRAARQLLGPSYARIRTAILERRHL